MSVSTRQLTHDVRLEYRGNWHAGGVCRVRIYQGGGPAPMLPTIVLSELPENENTSVTNLIEYLAAEVVAAYLPEAFEALVPPIVVEHYPSRDELAERFDRVTFSTWRPRLDELGGARRVRLGAPEWRRLRSTERDELAGLVGPVGAEQGGRGVGDLY